MGHLVVANTAATVGQQCHGLGGVDGAATAESDNAVEIALINNLSTTNNHIVSGFRHRVGEELPGDIRSI